MVRCQECGKELTDENQHIFSGYGYLNIWCGGCCPKEFDGMICDKEHLPQWWHQMKKDRQGRRDEYCRNIFSEEE